MTWGTTINYKEGRGGENHVAYTRVSSYKNLTILLLGHLSAAGKNAAAVI